jgi:hypothetical protein
MGLVLLPADSSEFTEIEDHRGPADSGVAWRVECWGTTTDTYNRGSFSTPHVHYRGGMIAGPL